MSETTQTKQPPRTTAAQLRIALALADAYGHEWAEAFRALEPPSREPLNLQNIVYAPSRYERLSAQGWSPLKIEELHGRPVDEAADAIRRRLDEAEGANREFRGIDAPRWDTDGDIHHTTGTGRLSWDIVAAGRVTINAWRPDEVHALLVVIDERGEVDRIEVTHQCRLRHLEAVSLAMRVVRAVHVPVVEGYYDLAPEWCDSHLGPLRRKVALADYADLKARIVALRAECEMIEAANMELHDEALDCQLPHTWGLEALRAWCEQVAVGTGLAGW